MRSGFRAATPSALYCKFVGRFCSRLGRGYPRLENKAQLEQVQENTATIVHQVRPPSFRPLTLDEPVNQNCTPSLQVLLTSLAAYRAQRQAHLAELWRGDKHTALLLTVHRDQGSEQIAIPQGCKLVLRLLETYRATLVRCGFLVPVFR